MNLFFIFLLLSFNFNYLRGGDTARNTRREGLPLCQFDYLEMVLRWPYTVLMMNPRNANNRYLKQYFALTDVLARRPIPTDRPLHRGECERPPFDFDPTNVQDALDYFPPFYNYETPFDRWAYIYRMTGPCFKSFRVNNVTEYYEFFIEQAKEFNREIFERALLNGVCSIKEITLTDPYVGYYECKASDLSSLINIFYGARGNLFCNYGNYEYDDGQREPSRIFNAYFLQQIRLCFDRERNMIDCQVEGNCKGTIYFPRHYKYRKFVEYYEPLINDPFEFL